MKMGNISNCLHSAQRSIFQYFIIHRALPNTWKQQIPSRYLPSFALLLPQTRTSDVTDYPHFSTVGHILIPAMGFPSTFILFSSLLSHELLRSHAWLHSVCLVTPQCLRRHVTEPLSAPLLESGSLGKEARDWNATSPWSRRPRNLYPGPGFSIPPPWLLSLVGSQVMPSGRDKMT